MEKKEAEITSVLVFDTLAKMRQQVLTAGASSVGSKVPGGRLLDLTELLGVEVVGFVRPCVSIFLIPEQLFSGGNARRKVGELRSKASAWNLLGIPKNLVH